MKESKLINLVKDKNVLFITTKNIDYITLHRVDLVIIDTKAHGKYFLKEFNGRDKLFETMCLEAD